MKLVLGTAQLGLPYGITNNLGQPSREESRAILSDALTNGIACIDTARAYGESEARIGEALGPGSARIVTKLAPDAKDEASTEASVRASLAALRRPRLDALLLHRWQHRSNPGVWQKLLFLRKSGAIGLLGASVGSPEEALEAGRDPDVALIQLPFNLLDPRWETPALFGALAARPDLEIHARSVFLQGILISGPELWPPIPGVDAPAWVRRIAELSRALGREGPADLCLAFAQGTPWIRGIVVGIASREQLLENVLLARRPPLTEPERKRVTAALAGAPEILLNPALWPKR